MFNINSAKKAIISHYREISDLGLRFPGNDRTDEVNKLYVFFKYAIMPRKTDTYFVVIKVSCLVHWFVLHVENLRCHGDKNVKNMIGLRWLGGYQIVLWVLDIVLFCTGSVLEIAD